MVLDPPDRSTNAPWHTRLLVLLVLVVPFGVAAGMLLHMDMAGALPVGDSGLLELAVRSAMYGEQLIGSYSRFGFNHPGPMYFYIQALPYGLFGGETVLLHLTAICLNAISCAGIAWVLWRTVNGLGLWFAVGAVGFYCMFLGQFLVEFWDPAVTILPFVFLFLCCAAGINGDFRVLGPAALAATFVVQSQLTYVPTVLTIIAVTAVCRLAPMRRYLSLPESRHGLRRRELIWWAVALALLWIPTCIDQLFGSGNLANILTAFLGDPQPSLRSFRENYTELCLATTRFFALPLGTGADVDARLSVVSTHVVLLVQLTILVIGGMVIGRTHPWIRGLGVLGLACVAAFLFSIHSIKGEFHFHITLWMSCIGLVSVLVAGFGLAAAMTGKLPRAGRIAGAVILWGVCAFLVYRNSETAVYHSVIARWQHRTSSERQLIESSRDEIVRALRADRRRPVAVRVEPEELWYGTSGLVLLLAREGFDARAVGAHEARFPRRYRLTAADRDPAELLMIMDERDPGPGYEQLGSKGSMRVYKRR